MKLRNKLIPLLSVATVATTLAPLATSCKSNGVKTLDLTQPFTPSNKAEGTTNPITREQAEDMYVRAVQANPDILTDDILYYEHSKLPARLEKFKRFDFFTSRQEDEVINEITNVDAKVKCGNVQVNTKEAIIDGIKTTFHTISFVLGYEFSFKAITLSEEPRLEINEHYSFNSTYNDVPLFMYASDEEGLLKENHWYLSIDLMFKDIEPYLAYVPGWYLDTSYTHSYDYKYTYDNVTKIGGNSNSYAKKINQRSQLTALQNFNRPLLEEVADNFLDFGSYYMKDVIATANPIRVNSELTSDTGILSLPGEIDSDNKKLLKWSGTIDFLDLSSFKYPINKTTLIPNIAQIDNYVSILNSWVSMENNSLADNANNGIYASYVFDVMESVNLYFEDTLKAGDIAHVVIPAYSCYCLINYYNDDGQEAYILAPIAQRIRFNITIA